MPDHHAVRRALCTVAVLVSYALLAAAPAHAQGMRFGFGATGIFSLERGGGSRAGGLAVLQFGRREWGASLRLDGTFTHGGGDWNEIATANLVYTFHTPHWRLHPYVLGGGGISHVPGVTKPLAKGGLGFDYHLVHRNRGPVLFGESSLNVRFAGDADGGTQEAVQANLGVRLTL